MFSLASTDGENRKMVTRAQAAKEHVHLILSMASKDRHRMKYHYPNKNINGTSR